MNFFSVLGDSDDEETPKVNAKKGGNTTKEAPKKDGKKDAPAAKKDAPSAKPTVGNSAEQKNNKAKENNAPANKNKENNKAPRAAEVGEGDDAAGKEERHKKHRERHGEKKHGGVESGKRPPKREFERRSGTGRGREVSRGGRGPYGAGNVEQEAIDAEKDPKSAVETAAEGTAESAEEEVEEVVPAEPESSVFTLDEFLKTREEARQRAVAAGLAGSSNVRTVNRDTEFAGMTTLSEALEDYVAASVTKAEAAKKDQRSTSKTAVLDVGFKLAAPQVSKPREEREGNFRGNNRSSGRGEARGRSGRGPRDGGRGGGRIVLNNADFPSL